MSTQTSLQTCRNLTRNQRTEVTEMGTAATGFLAKYDNSNSYRLAQADCCEVLAQGILIFY